MKPKEIPVCGLAAVQALFDREPASIKRLFFDAPTSRRVSKMASYLAQTKRIYRVVTPEELGKVAGTLHHGGIVAVVEAKPLSVVTDQQIDRWAEARAPLLVLDRIGNAHNLGAIARSAAYFGVEHIVLPEDPQQALPSEAAHRTAEGGMAHLTFWGVRDLPAFCRSLARRFVVVGTTLGPGSQPFDKWISEYTRKTPRLPAAVVLGNEEHGMAPAVAQACSVRVRIPGRGDRVESLNVSVAAALLIWELWGRPAAGKSTS